MDRIVKIGVIGCGGIANGKHFPSLKKLPNVQIVAVCDLIEERAVKAAKDFGTPDCKVFTDYKELLKIDEIEVIHVCTPNRSHSFISIDAMEAGKHVMCEKPMAINAEEAKKMLDASKRTGKKLTIGYQARQRKDSRFIKSECEQGNLGDIYFAKAIALRRRAVPTWGVFCNKEEQGGGPLIDIGTHALDLTLWCMDNWEPAYCVGTTYNKLSQTQPIVNSFAPWDPETYSVEDCAFGFVVMKNGATVFLESSWALNMLDVRESSTLLCGTKAGIDMADGVRMNGVRGDKLYSMKVDLNVGGVDFYEGDGASETNSDREARFWIDAVINDKEPVVTPEQAYTVSRILDGIYESSRTGKPVYFD